MVPCTGTLRGSTMAVGPQARPVTATLATAFGGIMMAKQRYRVLTSWSHNCPLLEQGTKLGDLHQNTGPKESRYILSLLGSGWGVIYDKYLAVGYFHPINLYFHFKVAHVGNLKPIC